MYGYWGCTYIILESFNVVLSLALFLKSHYVNVNFIFFLQIDCPSE